MKLAFGSMTGQNDSLFQNLRNMSLSRDAGAPVGISVEERKAFENRRDVCDLRAKAEQARGTKAFRSLKSQINTLLQALSELRLEELRAEYFSRVDCLRAQGLPTSASSRANDSDGTSLKARSDDALVAVAQFISSCTPELDIGCSVEEHAKQYMELLVDYLAHRSGTSNIAVWGGAPEPLNEPADLDRTCVKQSRCLLCNKPFQTRSDLTKHCQRIHVRSGTFNWDFECPECLRLGLGNVKIESPPAWSVHVETAHGKIYAPNLPSISPPLKGSSLCLLCGNPFQEGAGMWRHTQRTHNQKQRHFDQLFPCPECLRQEKGNIYIEGFLDWKRHVLTTHTEMEKPQQGSSTGERKRDEGDVMPNYEVNTSPQSGATQDDWSESTITISDTTGITSGTDSNVVPNAESPASSVDPEVPRNIDPRLLSGYLGQGQKEAKTSLSANLGTVDYDHYLPTQNHIAAASLHHPGPALGSVREAVRAAGSPLPGKSTFPNLAIIGIQTSSYHGRNGELLLDSHDQEDDRVEPVQRSTHDKGIQSISTGAFVPKDQSRDLAREYWGRGWAIVPEGSELNRATNNAKRRGEISSSVTFSNVIEGKRRRIVKNTYA